MLAELGNEDEVIMMGVLRVLRVVAVMMMMMVVVRAVSRHAARLENFFNPTDSQIQS